jgi:hypothetical protein
MAYASQEGLPSFPDKGGVWQEQYGLRPRFDKCALFGDEGCLVYFGR